MSLESRNALRGKFETLLPMIEELDKDWIADWDDDKQEKFVVVLHHRANVCFVSADRDVQRIGCVYMSNETAVIIKDKINKTLVNKFKGASDANRNVHTTT